MTTHDDSSPRDPRATALRLLPLLPFLLLGACGALEDFPTEASHADEDPLYGLGSLGGKWPNGVVPVCWQDPSDHPELQAKIPGILKATWSRAANITFTGFGACTGNHHVSVVFSTVPDFRGRTSTLGYGTPTVTLVSDDTRRDLAHFRYEVIHEFGHALGFTHEMRRPDNWNKGVARQCGVSTSDGDYPQYAPQPGGITLTATYDSDSVMNYCNPAGYPITLSAGDIAGAQRSDAYGPPPQGPTADILWHNTSTGAFSMWLMSGASIVGAPELYTEPLEWTVGGAGDFDGDGASDILWRNTRTGLIAMWLMSGGTILAAPQLYNEPAEWTIQGVGDFDGDGRSDILWRNTNTGVIAMWLMSGGTILAAPQLQFAEPTEWKIERTADFDGDGRSDIFWRNTNTGAMVMWLMSGGTILSTPPLPYARTSEWIVAGAGDFDGDGQSDILWRNTSTGAVQMWLMSGGTILSTPNLYTEPAEWRIDGVGDFDGDGQSDIIWRNTSTGVVAMWLMSGGTILSAPQLYAEPAEWRIEKLGDFSGR